jgi:hypothetical protein
MCKTLQSNGLTSFGGVIDLNCKVAIRSAVSSRRRRHEQRTEPVFATHRSLAPAPVSPVRATLRWQLSRAELFLLGPVSFHDLRTVELPRKSTRHRCLPALARTSALSSGNPAVETLSIKILYRVVALLHVHCCHVLGDANVLIHCHCSYLMRAFCQCKRCKQLVAQGLSSLCAIHPKFQPLDPHRRIARSLDGKCG